MSNYKNIRNIIKRMSGQDNVITVPKIYVEYTGDLTTAVLLNQIVFYSDKSKRKDGFFYKTYKEWEEEICLTKRQVSYSTEKLKKLGILETEVMKANGAPTVHYKLDYDKLVDSIVTKCNFPLEQNVTLDSNKMSQSLTENTTENTTEIYSLYDFWNEQGIIRHRKMTEQMKRHARARLEEYEFEELKKAIQNYADIVRGEQYYWTHKWTFAEFMKPGNVVRFLDEADPFTNYSANKPRAKHQPVPKPQITGKTKEQIEHERMLKEMGYFD